MIKFSKEGLESELKRRGWKIPALAELTGIPKDRIYAWYRDDTNPKAGDQVILEAWLNDASFKKNEEVKDKDMTIYNLSEAQIILAKAVYLMAEKISFGEPGKVSLPLQEKESIVLDPTDDLRDISNTDSEKKKDKQKDSGKN